MLKKEAVFFNEVLSVKGWAVVQIILASCFIALCAQIKIPLFFTPVPFTLQGIGMMSVGAFLGKKRGVLAVMVYLIQGCLGLPVWAGGSSAGALYLLGPTGGYLLAYSIQVFLIGFFVEQFGRSHFFKLFSWFSLAVIGHLLLGSLWLAQFVGLNQCLFLGFSPFILGDLTKAALVAWVSLKSRKC